MDGHYLMKTDSPKLQSKTLKFWPRTFSSLRYHSFRMVWLGSVSEHFGQHMETMAIAWLMKELTESPYYLGLLVVCRVAPLLPFALIGGVVADRFDRRALLINCFRASALISIALFVLVQTGTIAPWHLLTSAVLSGVVTGFNHPARAAIIPNVIPKEELMNAVALDSFSVRTAGLVSAPLAGVIISLYGTSPLFGARAIGMVLALMWLFKASVPPPTRGGSGNKAFWNNLSLGLKYALGNSLIAAMILVFALREFQADMTKVFLPFFATDILNSGALGFGYLNAAHGMGGLLGLFVLASLGNFRRKGWLIIIAGLITGLFLMVFAISHWLILSLVLLMVANISGTAFENVNRTVLQTITPDEMRGRVMSLREAVRGLFGPWVAYGLGLGGEYLGVTISALLLGLFLSAGMSLLALLVPAFRKL